MADKRAAKPGPAAQRVGKVDPVGTLEIGTRLGQRPQTVAQWNHRGLLPAPRWTVSGRPAWDWPDVEAWARETGRLPQAKGRRAKEAK